MSFDISSLGVPLKNIGIVLVDHGSRRAESNDLLLQVVDAYRQHADWQIVEPAHMELAEPSIATAFRRCVERGAELVVVFPYFLAPGRHWHVDIPALSAEAAQACVGGGGEAESTEGVRFLVAEPLGLHELLLQVVDQRIADCLKSASGR